MEPKQIKTFALPTSHPQLVEIKEAAEAVKGVYIKTSAVRVCVGEYAIEFRWQGGDEWAFSEIATILPPMIKVSCAAGEAWVKA
jgi:hypothetical protein